MITKQKWSGRDKEECVAVSIYIVSRKNQLPRTLREIGVSWLCMCL
jgi:transcription initiation factor TFIIIB Brf1 subunit/transcription initiation factor TFIIB